MTHHVDIVAETRDQDHYFGRKSVLLLAHRSFEGSSLKDSEFSSSNFTDFLETQWARDQFPRYPYVKFRLRGWSRRGSISDAPSHLSLLHRLVDFRRCCFFSYPLPCRKLRVVCERGEKGGRFWHASFEQRLKKKEKKKLKRRERIVNVFIFGTRVFFPYHNNNNITCVCVCTVYTHTDKHYDPNFSVHSFLFLKRPAVMIFDGYESALAHFRSSIYVAYT